MKLSKNNSSEFSIEKDMIWVLKNLKGNSMSVGKGGYKTDYSEILVQCVSRAKKTRK